MLSNIVRKTKLMLSSAIEIRQQVWVVSISKQAQLSQSLIVNEDDFDLPFEWMIKRGYSDTMIKQIRLMKTSSVLSFELEDCTHQIVRVK